MSSCRAGDTVATTARRLPGEPTSPRRQPGRPHLNRHGVVPGAAAATGSSIGDRPTLRDPLRHWSRRTLPPFGVASLRASRSAVAAPMGRFCRPAKPAGHQVRRDQRRGQSPGSPSLIGLSHTISAPWFESRMITVVLDGPGMPESHSRKVRPVVELGRAGLGRALANEPARPPWGTSLPGARPWTGQNGSKPHAAACGAADERVPADAEASGLAPEPVSSSDPGRCSVSRATGCARQCGRRHPRSPGLGTAVRRE
jgi:hypothetical protein